MDRLEFSTNAYSFEFLPLPRQRQPHLFSILAGGKNKPLLFRIFIYSKQKKKKKKTLDSRLSSSSSLTHRFFFSSSLFILFLSPQLLSDCSCVFGVWAAGCPRLCFLIAGPDNCVREVLLSMERFPLSRESLLYLAPIGNATVDGRRNKTTKQNSF